MIPIRKLLKFFISVIMLYFLLIMMIQFLFTRKTIAIGFIKTTEKVLSITLPQAYLDIHPPDTSRISRFEYMVVINYCSRKYYDNEILKAQQQGLNEVSVILAVTTVNYFGFLFIQMAFLISLIIATPGTWKKKAFNTIIGLLLYLVYHNINMILYMLYIFSKSNASIYIWTMDYKNILSTIHFMFEVGGSLMVVVLIWLTLVARDKSLMTSIKMLNKNIISKGE